LHFFHVFLTFWWCIAITHNPYNIFSFHWKYSSVIFLFIIINVDIFGRCGKPCVKKGIDCIQNLSTYYKYYLAFENSICEDYVTEKLFRLYNTNFNIIPVVRGAPKISTFIIFCISFTYFSRFDGVLQLLTIHTASLVFIEKIAVWFSSFIILAGINFPYGPSVI
jgi:hypothetical protein